VSLANPWLDFLTPEEAIPAAFALNHDVETYCATYSPDDAAKSTEFEALTTKRLFGFGSLPLVPGVPIDEVMKAIELVVSLPHLRGVVMGTKGLGNGFDDPAMDRVWEKLAESGLVVFVVSCGKPRPPPFLGSLSRPSQPGDPPSAPGQVADLPSHSLRLTSTRTTGSKARLASRTMDTCSRSGSGSRSRRRSRSRA